MTDTPQQQTRDELLRRSREEHAKLEEILAPLSDEELTRPGVTGEWSVKDHLVHLTWWEQRVIRVLAGAPDPITAIPGEDKRSDIVNGHIFVTNRDRPLAEVGAAFDSSYQEMLRLIEMAPDDVLAKYYGWIDGNAASHYDEHVRMLQMWVAAR